MPTSICRCCTHPQAAEIDADIGTRMGTLRDVSRKYGIPKSSVHRHARSHLRARLKKAAAARAEGSDPELLDRVLDLHRRACELLDQAAEAKEFTAAASLIGRALQALELQGKLIGELHGDLSGTTINLNVIDEAAAERMARIFLQRRQPRAIDAVAVPALPCSSEVQMSGTDPDEAAK